MALGAFVQRGSPQGHSLVNRAPVANLGRLAHHHAHGVVEKHPLANARSRVDFNAGQPARHMRDEASQPMQAQVPAPVG